MIDFLVILALIWILAASISDIKKREVPNWLSFSLIAFALACRAFYSIFNNDLMFFLNGLIGLAIFIGLGYGFYYARIFAGGDAKLLMGLGAVLASSSILSDLWIFIIFILLLMLAGSLYGLIYSFALALKNFKSFSREFKRQTSKNKKLFYVAIVLALLSLLFVFHGGESIFFVFPILFLIFPLLFVYAKAIENSCMIALIEAKNLTEGDWLAEKLKFKGKVIEPYWEGLSEKQVKFLKGYRKKVKVKQGIPFVPAFLIAFILLALIKVRVYNMFHLF